MERKSSSKNQSNTNLKREPEARGTYRDAVQRNLDSITNKIQAERAQRIPNVNLAGAEQIAQKSEEKTSNVNTGCKIEDLLNLSQSFKGPFPNQNRSQPVKTLPPNNEEKIKLPKAEPGDVNGSELTRHIEELVKAIEEDLEKMTRKNA